MAKKNAQLEDGRTLATLALAKSIVDGDVTSAKEALDAGGDIDAFWIDGRRKLRELVVGRDPQYRSAAMAKLLASESLKAVPTMKEDRSLWSKEFVRFVAMRGHRFGGNTISQSRQVGVHIKRIPTSKAAIRRIESKWALLGDATCRDDSKGETSLWRLSFDADWNRDRRIAGFRIDFTVDAPGCEVVAMFKAAVAAGEVEDQPNSEDPLILRQKEWEGENIADETLDKVGGDVDDMIACMRKGGSPFFEFQGALIGHCGETPEAGAFMDVLREAVGPGPGWHLRIAPLLTKNAMQSIRDKAALRLEVPKPAPRRKSLKERADIV